MIEKEKWRERERERERESNGWYIPTGCYDCELSYRGE